jgi:GC-rich sequence DNA-binding factor
MEDEDDEETQEWEMAQVRRAGGWKEEEPEKPTKPSYQPTPSKSGTRQQTLELISVPSARPLPTIAPVQSRLANSLAQLSVTKSQNEHTLETNVRDLAALEEQEIDLRKEVERVEGKREWVEEFRQWIEMLGRFLEEKVCDFSILMH